MMDRTGIAAILTLGFAALSVAACAQDHTPPPAPTEAQTPAQAQDHRAMGHGGTTLFLAQAVAANVVPSSTSTATATGAFLINATKRTVDYEITFHGLEHGPPKNIALYNFGAGGNGAAILTICGADVRPCPVLASANLTGTWDGQGRARLDGQLLGELASARVYLEIVGGDGKPEISGQLEANDAMVPVKNYVAHLAPAPGVDSKGTGTAVLSEIHFPDGRVSVFYRLTVAGTSGAPRDASLVGVPGSAGPSAASAPPLKFVSRNALPRIKLLPSKANAAGGTMTGEYQVDPGQPEALFATKILAAGNREVGITVSTSEFPDGELSGVFKPVQ